MTDKELDEVIIRNINQIEIPFEINVDEIISVAESKKKRRKIKAISIITCVMLILVVTFSIMLNSKKEESNIEMNAHDKKIQEVVEEEPQTKENYGIINVKVNTTACYYIPDIKDMYYRCRDVNHEYSTYYSTVIAKVENVTYTNYDKDDSKSYDYTFLRTIANIKIMKTLSGNLKEGEEIIIRANGGMLEYNEYMKYWERWNKSSLDLEVYEQKYNEYIQEGKTKVYVSEYKEFEKELEEGKTYLMFVLKRNWGDYWIENVYSLLREYNEIDNTVLNNKTGEYENLDLVLN